jgi:CTP:molybdopterin cytidylyltransferase MocA
MKEDGLAAIVLAAGYSCRLGRPKQLVEYSGEPLIRRAVRLALEIGAAPALIVLPAGLVSMQQALTGLTPVEILENGQATEGMGSSLRLSMETLLSRNVIPRRLLLLTCDQPLIEVSHLQSLLLAHSPNGITAARYNHRPGVPAVFGTQHFPALARANGDQGARALLRSGSVTMVDMPEAELDIDTSEDLRRLQVFDAGAPK